MTSVVEVHHVIEAADHLPADAPWVVLSGSLGSTLEMWDRTAPALAQVARVVRYDTRGHGRSPVADTPTTMDALVDDVIALMDRLGIERAHVMGLSLGGSTMLRLAQRHPERVDTVTVLCSSAYFGAPSAWQERAALVRAEGVEAVADAVVARWYSPGFADAQPQRYAAARAMIAATPAEGYAACCDAIAGWDARAWLDQVAAPVLAIAGADDPATPPEHLRLIADGVADGRLLIVERAAHLANDEQPDKVNAALIEHIGRPADSQIGRVAARKDN